ncbi:ATP-binding protein [Idiomarina sp.]|uniref:ATP-binding protein n=1 Tax=Idiomarina sp. TaxID=1874361 RepID=UPI003512B3A7
MNVERAVYKMPALPEYRLNPLISALPERACDESLITYLSYYPECLEFEKTAPSNIRVQFISRLDQLRQPIPVYLQCYRAIEEAIIDSYSMRNPLSPTTNNYLHYSEKNRPQIRPRTGFFRPKASGITVIGESGVGKTTMLEQILSCFPDRIEHRNFHGHEINFGQVVWIMVNCPSDSSIRGLCHEIIEQISLKQGTPAPKPARNLDDLITQIGRLVKSSFLGILVIDEMQNLNIAKAGGEKRLVSFLHNFMNAMGVPIILCANPPFQTILSDSLKTARRAESKGYFKVDLLPNDEIWELFVESLWELQWTNQYTPLSPELLSELHTLSYGNIEIAIRIFRNAQKFIIGSNDERITVDVLRYTAANSVTVSRLAMESGKKKEAESFAEKVKEAKQASKKSPPQRIESEFRRVPEDLSRAQHKEFNCDYTKYSLELLSELDIDTDVFQRATETSSPIEDLRHLDLVCDAPLERFK